MAFYPKNNVPILYMVVFAVAALLVSPSFGAVLQWNSTGEPQVAGYKAYIGMESRNYVRILDTMQQTHVTLTGLDAGTTYYFAATAYDATGLESDFSDEVRYTPPVDGDSSVMLPFSFENTGNGIVLRMVGEPGQRCWIVASADLKTWQQIRSFTFSDNSSVEISDPSSAGIPMRFYRVIASRP